MHKKCVRNAKEIHNKCIRFLKNLQFYTNTRSIIEIQSQTGTKTPHNDAQVQLTCSSKETQTEQQHTKFQHMIPIKHPAAQINKQ